MGVSRFALCFPSVPLTQAILHFRLTREQAAMDEVGKEVAISAQTSVSSSGLVTFIV